MTLVGYFFSRCGEVVPGRKSPRPPKVLNAVTWVRAYAMFYSKLGGGRPFVVFRNSMKNVRDYFDSHIESGRVGWRDKNYAGQNRSPRPLSHHNQEVIDAWQHRSNDELWNAVVQFCDQSVQCVSDSIISDLAAELETQSSRIIVRTEGGSKAIVSIRIERSPSLRAAALKIHGTTCSVCGFDFGEMYGEWGDGFAIVHHLIPLGIDGRIERQTDPATDLSVVCANCHCMIHRRQRIALTIQELRAKLRHTYRTIS